MQDLNEFVKQFLRIDSNDDINVYVDMACSYIKESVGSVDDGDPLTRYLIAILTQEFYDNRVLTMEQAKDQVRYMAHSILLQLQLCHQLKEEENESESGGAE